MGDSRTAGEAPGAAGSSKKLAPACALSNASTLRRKPTSSPHSFSKQAARSSGGNAQAAAKIVSSSLGDLGPVPISLFVLKTSLMR
jgi:hypothetical protein